MAFVCLCVCVCVCVGGCVCVYVCMCVCQPLSFGDRVFDVTVAARPEFINVRRTDMPDIVLGVCIGIVVVLVVLITIVGMVLYRKQKEAMMKRAREEQHRLSIVEASKLAHERTIAYACHQLRCAWWWGRLVVAWCLVEMESCRVELLISCCRVCVLLWCEVMVMVRLRLRLRRMV